MRLPPNTSGRVQTTTPTATWVAEGALKPVTSMGFDAVGLVPRKVVSTIVVSNELARAVAPRTVDSLTRALASACAAAVDTAAFDPTLGATPGRPASLTNGATEVPATGEIAADVGNLLAAISEGAPTSPYLVTGWPPAAQMAAMLEGLRALGCGVLISPGAGELLIAIDAAGVAIASEDVRLLTSTHGDVLLDDGSSPPATTTVRLFQQNLVALMAEHSINWTTQPNAVAWMASAGSPA